MKVYDTHSDILHNLYERTLNGEKNVFEADISDGFATVENNVVCITVDSVNK